MTLFIPNIATRTGIRVVLLAQLVMAGLLVASDLVTQFPATFRENVELPTGPVLPGDQRREYRNDRSVPNLVELEEPADLTMPDQFPNRLSFTQHEIEGMGKILLLSGEIENGDATRFSNFLSEMKEKPDVVALHSPGGIVFEALKIGNLIREKELSTVVLASAYCMSSCPYILAGGVNRAVSLHGIVGLHQHYYEQPKYIPVIFAVESIQIGQGETMEYLIGMGVDPSLMVYSLKTPPEQIYALVEKELIETRLATEIIN